MKLTKIIIFLACISFMSCSSDQSEQQTSRTQLLDSLNVPDDIKELDNLTVISRDDAYANEIKFTNQTVVGLQYLSMRPPPPFSGGSKIAVDSRGSVYMVNQTENVVNVFDSTGTKLENIGREGRGPGEFAAIGGMDIFGNKVLVNDASLLRLQIFSIPSGELEKITKIKPQKGRDDLRFGRPSVVYFHSDSTYLANYALKNDEERSNFGYYILDSETEISSDIIFKILRPKYHQFTMSNGMASGMSLPFSDEGIWAINDDSQLYHANTSQFLIKIYDTNGEYQKAFFHPFDHDPLEEDEVLNDIHENWHKNIREVSFPDYWPALQTLLVDDKNRIWVSTIVDDHSVYEWWVLDDTGELLGTFTWPRNRPIEVIKNDRLYVRLTDREKGVKQVIRYDIEINGI